MQRFVRVACPARGTTLTSGRLDRWLSVVNLLTGNGLVADAADFLLAVVKERTDPRTLPGLEAMLPGSALTRLLQHPALVTNADLSVIAGDVEGEGLWGQLKLLAVDWFYGTDHDLVVNTGSMVGGIRRPEGGARFLRDRGQRVNHFRYFTNPNSLAWLVSGLLRDGRQRRRLPADRAGRARRAALARSGPPEPRRGGARPTRSSFPARWAVRSRSRQRGLAELLGAAASAASATSAGARPTSRSATCSTTSTARCSNIWRARTGSRSAPTTGAQSVTRVRRRLATASRRCCRRPSAPRSRCTSSPIRWAASSAGR